MYAFNQLLNVVGGNKDWLRSGIKVTHTHLVQMLQSENYFPDINPHRFLRKVISLVQVSKHFATAHIVCSHTQEQIKRGLEKDMVQRNKHTAKH